MYLLLLLLLLLLGHWLLVVVVVRRRWLLLLSMMTPRRPHHVRHERPRFSSFVFLHPIGDVIFLRSCERETQKREKKTDDQRDIKVTIRFCSSSSSFLPPMMPMSTLHISFEWEYERVVFFAAECVTF